MTNFPYFRAPFYNNYYHQYYSNNMPGNQKPNSDTKKEQDSNYESHFQNSQQTGKSSRYFSFGPINFKNPIFTEIEEPIFEIFGISLYLDDIIIIGLLFFLYQEGVKDDMLFISLILLLLD